MHGLATPAGRAGRNPASVRVAAVAWVMALVAHSGIACAQERPATSGAASLDGILEVLQLKGRVAPAPDFVTRSRPKADPGFMPVGAPHPDRPGKVKTPAEVAAMEADLDAARMRQQRRAGQAPPAVPLKQRSGAKSATGAIR